MKSFIISVIACFCIVTPLALRASHAIGGELRYEHLSGNDYRFHFILYRDCAGIPGAASYTINGTSLGGSSLTFTVDTDSIVNVSQMCAGVSDKCTNIASPYWGFQALYYHGDVTVPNDSTIWTFANAPICNRNAAINTLMPNGSTYCLYVETKLNNNSGFQNNSPVFDALPQLILCADDVQYLHLYARDSDGDSLVFEMYPAHSDDVTDVQYIPGLSATQPVTYAVPADSTRFYPATGDIRFKADQPQITVVAVQVNEFRNGIFVGSEERDIQVIFNNCSNHAPTASGINGNSSNFTTHICADSLFTFHINTTDVDGDSVRISWQNSIPGSTINLSGVNNQIANFNWQPLASDISTVPHVFTLYVTDSICPYVYFNSYQYRIYVDSCFVAPVAAFSAPQNVCAGTCISFTNLSTNASSYQWYFPGSIQDTSTLSAPTGICYPTPGNYDVQLIVSNASGSDTLLFPNYINVYPTAQAQSITQIGDSLFAIQGAATYQWYFNNAIITGATDYFYFATANGNYSVATTDSNGCESSAVLTEVIVGLTPVFSKAEGVVLFPNPVKDKFTIQKLLPIAIGITSATAPQGVLRTVEVSIYNVMGEKIISGLETTGSTTEIDVHDLPSGLYYLELSSSEKTLRTKFVKE